jgi:hypothetical protein
MVRKYFALSETKCQLYFFPYITKDIDLKIKK